VARTALWLRQCLEELADAWSELPQALAKTQARLAGFILNADRDELRALRFAIVTDHLPFDHVRRWFAERLLPR
jgi:hypothetical protein